VLDAAEQRRCTSQDLVMQVPKSAIAARRKNISHDPMVALTAVNVR
jgi:hypothetical protein